MAHRLVVLSCMLLGCAKPAAEPGAAPAGSIPDGRWTVLRVPMSYHFWKDSLEVVMYPPQAPPPPAYQVRGDTIHIAGTPTGTSHAYAIRGDTLHFQWPAGTRLQPMVRIAGDPANGLRGSWRLHSARMLFIFTFRSDSAFVMEVGVPQWPRRSGDTVFFPTERTPARMIFHQANGRLYGRNPDVRRNRTTTFVRRPWGCFGVGELDKSASECR